MPSLYNKCPKCLTVLGWKTEVCPECHYDLKNKVELQPRNDFMEHVFPWLLLGLALVMNLGVAIFRAGPAVGFVAVIISYCLVMLWQIPVAVTSLFLIGRLLSIDYGSVFTGIIKLAALFMFANGIVSLASLARYSGTGLYIGVTLCMLPVVMYYLFAVLFNLSIWEAILSLVSLYVLALLLRITLLVFLPHMLPLGASIWGCHVLAW